MICCYNDVGIFFMICFDIYSFSLKKKYDISLPCYKLVSVFVHENSQFTQKLIIDFMCIFFENQQFIANKLIVFLIIKLIYFCFKINLL
jgi:hypothetical protein